MQHRDMLHLFDRIRQVFPELDLQANSQTIDISQTTTMKVSPFVMQFLIHISLQLNLRNCGSSDDDDEAAMHRPLQSAPFEEDRNTNLSLKAQSSHFRRKFTQQSQQLPSTHPQRYNLSTTLRPQTTQFQRQQD
eukprot:c24816_g1_i1.p1 GENE.c24816_g1_i1~~c24816_g1_i1.p1  ORF type:complete len:134 (+),score=22.81 c24816_g1_i1:2-403(+)